MKERNKNEEKEEKHNIQRFTDAVVLGQEKVQIKCNQFSLFM